MNAAPTPTPPEVPEIRDIAPPMNVFPYPLWMVLTVVAGLLLLIGLTTWLFLRWWRKRPQPAPPGPRVIAMRELDSLRARIENMEPYRFSIAVSDVLRGFIAAQYGLRATKQTSPEFLASIAKTKTFTEDDRTLLAEFLEHCDLIKFAHIDATSADSAALLRSAIAFVQGVRA